jgi:hypothetical protein
MTQAEVVAALTARLKWCLPLYRILEENRDGLPLRPYLVLDVVPVSRTDNTLRGGLAIRRGFLQVTVVTEAGSYAFDALTIAAEVEEAFTYGLRLPAGGGEIVITKPPETGQGFRDGPDWRVPVRVDYEAHE